MPFNFDLALFVLFSLLLGSLTILLNDLEDILFAVSIIDSPKLLEGKTRALRDNTEEALQTA